MSIVKFETAVANLGGAMEAETISKNGQSSKSQMSRKNLIKICFALLTALFINSGCDKDKDKDKDKYNINDDKDEIIEWISDYRDKYNVNDDKDKIIEWFSDYRDEFTGVYVGKATYTLNGIIKFFDQTVTVSKSSMLPNQLVFSGQFYDDTKNETFAADVSKDGIFSGTLSYTIDGASTLVDIRNGKFSNNKLTYVFSTSGNVTITVDVSKL